MPASIPRVFLDTNVYIVGAALADSPEEAILIWLNESKTEVIVSKELIEQIARVARRIRGKDWCGEVLSLLWGFEVVYIIVNDDNIQKVEAIGIPREDVELYLAAKLGKTQTFVSANHELIRALADKTGNFESLTPEAFLNKYLK